MQKILLATGNIGKANEMLEVLQSLPCEFLTLADLNLENDAQEIGETHEENALIKARYFFQKTKLPTIGEDSGITVDALRGELGIHTRRWGAGEQANDQEWLDYFLDIMSNENNRKATFYCASAFVFQNDEMHLEKIFTGETKGKLTTEPQCPLPAGIPISALFIPENHTRVYAALNNNEKNAISHRGKTMKQLKEYLADFLLEIENT